MLNWIGGAIVVFWMVMVGLLIQKTHFEKEIQHSETSYENVPLKDVGRDWMEIYLKGSKVGYSMTQTDPLRDDYLVWEEVVLNLNLVGQASAMRTQIRSLLDGDFRLKRFTLRVESGAVRFQMSGRMGDHHMQIETGEGADQRTHVIELPEAPVTGAAMSMFFRGRPLKVGDSFTFSLFDPMTLAQRTITVSVVRKETIDINRVTYPAFRLETEMWGHKVVFWVNESGEVLKEEGFMGLTLVRSSASEAPRDLKGGESSDFYEMAAIDVNPKLRQPEKITYLKMRLEGPERARLDVDALNNGRQRYSGDIVEVTQEKGPLKGGYVLPLMDVGEDIRPYLMPGFTVQSDDGAIVNLARKVVSNTRDPLVVSRKLLTWVYRHVEKRPVLSLPSAVEVLKTRVGDCNEHAVLLTALLRAAGVPARECVGLVYARERFYYHAWTEAYIGRWVSMDATLNQLPADATHLKLVQGGLDRQMDIIPLIGKLKLSVVDYGYDTAH